MADRITRWLFESRAGDAVLTLLEWLTGLAVVEQNNGRLTLSSVRPDTRQSITISEDHDVH